MLPAEKPEDRALEGGELGVFEVGECFGDVRSELRIEVLGARRGDVQVLGRGRVEGRVFHRERGERCSHVPLGRPTLRAAGRTRVSDDRRGLDYEPLGSRKKSTTTRQAVTPAPSVTTS